MAIPPPSSDEPPSEEFHPLGSRESRLREAEKIRQDFVRSTKHLPRQIRDQALEKSGQEERDQGGGPED